MNNSGKPIYGQITGWGAYATFVVVTGCTGFVYALSTAYQFIQTGAYRNILVVSVELLSRFVDWTEFCPRIGRQTQAGLTLADSAHHPDRGQIDGLPVGALYRQYRPLCEYFRGVDSFGAGLAWGAAGLAWGAAGLEMSPGR